MWGWAQAVGLADTTIRWMSEDCLTFVEREVKRGNKYDALIFDRTHVRMHARARARTHAHTLTHTRTHTHTPRRIQTISGRRRCSG